MPRGVASLECRQHGERFDPAARVGYLFNTTIAGIEHADAVSEEFREPEPVLRVHMPAPRSRHLGRRLIESRLPGLRIDASNRIIAEIGEEQIVM